MNLVVESVPVETPDFWVFFGRAGAALHKCVAGPATMARPPSVGEEWAVEGHEKPSRVHGIQLHIASAKIRGLSHDHISTFLAKHRRFRNIGLGLARIHALTTRFGRELATVLNGGDHMPLAEVIPADVALELSIGWGEIAVEARFVTWAGERGIPPRPAMKAFALLGSQAQSALETDPYLLVAVMGFPEVDAIGRRMGVPKLDVRRRLAAVKSAFYELVETGSTAADPAWLIARTAAVSGADGEEAVSDAMDAGVARVCRAGLQPAGCSAMERRIEERVAEMLRTPDHSFPGLETEIAAVGAGLVSAQKAAVWTALAKPLSVICGGAGTGKTTALRTLVGVAGAANVPVVMCAVSGQAAGRMRVATGAHAVTVAALLHQAIEAPLPAGVLLVLDEASMADLRVIHRLLEILPADGRLTLVGDPAQLPPVGMGLVFHVLAAPGSGVPCVELTQIMRQSAASGIPVVAQAMRAGALPALPAFDGVGTGVSLLETKDPISAAVDAWQSLIRGPEGVNGVQVLTALRRDVETLNRRIQAIRNGPRDSALDEWGLRCGDHIVCGRNDYSLGIWNGSLGVMNAAADQSFMATIDGAELEIPESYMGNVELGYAVSVHKAQGSQFPRVVVPVTDSRILDRALLYTATTRARHQVVLAGNRDLIAHTISSIPAADRRRVGFDLRQAV